MITTLNYVWGCYNSTTGIGYYSAGGRPIYFPEGQGRDTDLDFSVCYGEAHEAKNTREACQKAREKLTEMGVNDIRPITAGHP